MDIKVVEALGHVEVKWSGRFESLPVVDSFADVLNCSTGGFILDVRAADLNVPVQEIESTARRVSRLLGGKVLQGAVIAPDRLRFGLMRMFVAFLGGAGEGLRVCRSQSEGLAALEARDRKHTDDLARA